MIIILFYYIILLLITSFLFWKNLFYNRKLYNRLPKMIFVNGDSCIKGYLSENKSAVFYYWKDSGDFMLDDSLSIYLHKSLIWTNPYNIYWYFRFKKFILKQKTYTPKVFYHYDKTLFISLKREKALNTLLNN